MPAIAGGEHSLYLTPSNSKLYSTGACGLGWCRLLPLTPHLVTFRPVPLPSTPITQIHASYYHNLAVTNDDRRLYSWGCGTFVEGGGDGAIPALGHGNDAEDRGAVPRRVPLPPIADGDGIEQITGGAYHSAVLLRSGTVLTFGAGQLGQLGREVEGSDASGLPVDGTARPVTEFRVKGVEEEEVRSIGASFYNTFAICGRRGRLYCTGENQNRQCGEGPRNLERMTEVKEVSGEDNGGVVQVEGGYCHTLVRKRDGSVYSLGCGDDGQRGDGRREEVDDDEEDGNDGGNAAPPRPTATLVPLPTPAASIAAGANHSVVLTDDGRVYAFGANDVGQCGVVPSASQEEGGGPVLSPLPVDLPPGVGRVASVSAGYAHTVLTTEGGRVFVFGQNDNGQLGLDGGVKEVEEGRDPMAQVRPVEVRLPS